MYNWAVSYQPKDFNTVVVHGNADGQFADRPNAKSQYFPMAIARLLVGTPGYDPKLKTKLIACNSGQFRNGQASGAQGLSDALGLLGNPNGVVAPLQLMYAPGTLGAEPTVAPGVAERWDLKFPGEKH